MIDVSVLQTAFARQGYARLSAAIDATATQAMRQRLWDFLSQQHGAQPDQPETWTPTRPGGFQDLSQSGAFNALASPTLEAALDQLLGQGAWQRPKHWGMPLVTFPEASVEWRVPHQHWHLDFAPRRTCDSLPGLRLLAFLAPVMPHGGGTLLIEGSHTLVERTVASGNSGGHSAHVRRTLARSNAWLRELWSANAANADRERRFMVEGAVVDGIPLRVVELTGAPGDIIVMHPWMLHAAAPNCDSAPRMMLSHSVFCAS